MARACAQPENILFTKTHTLKLADFGLAIDAREERAVTRAGTLDYMAPEVRMGQGLGHRTPRQECAVAGAGWAMWHPRYA